MQHKASPLSSSLPEVGVGLDEWLCEYSPGTE
jgi:hypothetical protein